jgi:hypothetical protein
MGRLERQEEVMKARSYLDGFGAVGSVLDLDAMTRLEIVEALDPERQDPLVSPWKRSYHAAIRRALGH